MDTVLKRSLISTPIGRLVAIADDSYLYLLEFADSPVLEKKLASLKTKVIFGKSIMTDAIEKELDEYFKGNLQTFKTPVFIRGTPFQKDVWNSLLTIPYNSSICYQKQAEIIENPKSFRAVANANSANKLVIIIPCHRVIQKGGKVGGYASGIQKKEWLLKHEERNGHQ